MECRKGHFVDMFYLCVIISQDMLEVSVVTNM